MAIKEIILSLCRLLSRYDISVQPETLRLSKFNEPSAHPEMVQFVLELVNFVTQRTVSSTTPVSSLEELSDVARIIGYPHFEDIKTSSYACLKLLLFLLQEFNVLSVIEEDLQKRVARLLNCEFLYEVLESKSAARLSSTDLYEASLEVQYKKRKLQRIQREFACKFSAEPIVNRTHLPGTDLSGSTLLDAYITHHEDISAVSRELTSITELGQSITQLYKDFPVLTKWVNSVDYGLASIESEEHKLVSQIVELHALVEEQLARGGAGVESRREGQHPVYLHTATGHPAPVSDQLCDLERRIEEQKNAIRELITG